MKTLKILSIALCAFCLSCPAMADARHDFKRANPCPSQESPRIYGEVCRGWKIGYFIPLKCGGKDHASNMYWIRSQPSTDERKALEKREKLMCQKK